MAREIVGSTGSCAPWRLLAVLLAAGFLAVVLPVRGEAQGGCCYCNNCPTEVGPFCADLMDSSVSCVDLCITQRTCDVAVFSPQGTCAGGCGDNPPFFSPTPTATPTETVTDTPTISPIPSSTPTPLDTPTPVYCCQGASRCGIANPSNEESCLVGETPVENAACLAGDCRTFTPTFTRTNTPPPTNTRTNTPTPTSTDTPTPTPTIHMGNLFNCDRITADKSSARKGDTFIVTDPDGRRSRIVLKPRYLCNPGVFGGGMPQDPHVLLTCYKVKDNPKIAGSGPWNIRNEFENPIPLPVTIIKGDLLCIPSYRLPTPAPKPTATKKP